EALSGGGESGEDIELGNHCRGLPDAFGLLGNAAANVLKNILLDLENLLFSGEDLFFVFFQLRRDEPLGADQRLLAIVIAGNQVQVGLRNLDVIAEDFIESNFQRTDARAPAFTRLN